jgi:hypothetical protein
MARPRSAGKTNNSANIGFEAKLWLAADKLRSNMDAAEYKHVVLGLIFLQGEETGGTLGAWLQARYRVEFGIRASS